MILLKFTPARPFRRCLALAFLAAIFALAIPGSASAALIVSVQSTTVTAGSTGDTLDVTLTNTGTTPSPTISGFSFEINASSPPITFTAVNISTTSAPYIFASHSTFGPDISLTITPASLQANDVFNPATSGITVPAGSTVGLGHVFFNVSSTASGMIPVSLFGLNTDTNLAGPAPSSPAITINGFSNGAIMVGGAAVPAPSSLLMGLIAGGSLLVIRGIRHARGRWPFPSPATPAV